MLLFFHILIAESNFTFFVEFGVHVYNVHAFLMIMIEICQEMGHAEIHAPHAWSPTFLLIVEPIPLICVVFSVTNIPGRDSSLSSQTGAVEFIRAFPEITGVVWHY